MIIEPESIGLFVSFKMVITVIYHSSQFAKSPRFGIISFVMDPDSCSHLCNILNLSAQYNGDMTVWGMPQYVVWILIVVLLLISGLFSASENAYSNCNKYHFQVLANKGSRTAKLVVRLVEKFDNTLITSLVGNNIVQTLMTAMSAILFLNLCNAMGINNGVEAILSTVVMALLIYIVSDTVPKILSKALPNKMAVFLAYPLTFVGIILFPVVWLFHMILKGIYKLFHIKSDNIFSKEDLLESVDNAVNLEEKDLAKEESEALFENDEKEIIDNIFSFGDLEVKDVYTPISKVVMVDINRLTTKKLNNQLARIPFSRLPVFDRTKNDIVGILVMKNYFEEYAKDEHLDIKQILVSPIFVEPHAKLGDTFRLLNKEKTHLAMVKDGENIIGIITMDDILEEIMDDTDTVEKTQKAKEVTHD